jgi:UDPglucose--hexose-1-phosphate uridylyltransferase
MPQLRKDPVLGRWVIISTERGKRPSDFPSEKKERKSGFCPFCEGCEDKTPPEVLAYRRGGTAPNTPGWDVRVVPNKFPALAIEGDLDRAGEGMYDKMNGVGAHEVIIESPEHDQSLSDLSVEHVELVVKASQERMLDLQGDTRFRYILLFKNRGGAAGASLDHPHLQLIAMPILPKRVTEELAGSKKYYGYKERCVFCDMVAQETWARTRVVCENERFLTMEPFAPRFPFETWILPKKHDPAFEDMHDEGRSAFASILKETLTRINAALNDPPYNFIVHTSPTAERDLDYYHWHVEIMPKLTKVAGFEWGSGFYINPTPPEDAANFLRDVSLETEEGSS